MSSGPRAVYRANLVLRAAEKWRLEMMEHPRNRELTAAELDLWLAINDYREEVVREHINGPDIDKDEKQ